MTWLIRILSKSNKNKRGFTLIELMVVVIVVGILAAAAIPIYRFAMSRAYSSEAKATIGTMLTSINMYEAEEPTTYVTRCFDKVSEEPIGSDIMSILGVDTGTNTWWHAGYELVGGTPSYVAQTSQFGTESETGVLPVVATITWKFTTTADGPWVWAVGLSGKIAGIQVAYGMGADKWYVGF